VAGMRGIYTLAFANTPRQFCFLFVACACEFIYPSLITIQREVLSVALKKRNTVTSLLCANSPLCA